MVADGCTNCTSALPILPIPAGFAPMIIAFVIGALVGLGLAIGSRAKKPRVSPGDELQRPSPRPGKTGATSEITSGLQGAAAGGNVKKSKKLDKYKSDVNDPLTAQIPDDTKPKGKKNKKGTMKGPNKGLAPQELPTSPKKSLATEEQGETKKKRRKVALDDASEGAIQRKAPPTKKSLATREKQGKTKKKMRRKVTLDDTAEGATDQQAPPTENSFAPEGRKKQQPQQRAKVT